MKVLTAQFYFLLPEDFADDEAEALRMLATYSADKAGRGEVAVLGEPRRLPEPLWEEFLKAVARGKRLRGILAVNTLPETTNPMGM